MAALRETGVSSPIKEFTHPDGIHIREFKTVDDTAHGAGMDIVTLPQYNPFAHITFATGDTMRPVAEQVVAIARQRGISFKGVLACHLDEYYPMNPFDKDSFVKFLRDNFFDPLGIPDINRQEINGAALYPRVEAYRYDQLLKKVGIDLAILGIGPGCHVGFNERGTPFTQRVSLVNLSEETVARDKSRGQNSPRKAITQGPANIMEAKKIMLVAYGEQKGAWLAEALYGPITPECPASVLRTQGNKVTIFIDSAAAAGMQAARQNYPAV